MMPRTTQNTRYIEWCFAKNARACSFSWFKETDILSTENEILDLY